jgi:mRNA-degrading endonuclease YafQ of YafQ-DinJ toxin-antitoxin module
LTWKVRMTAKAEREFKRLLHDGLLSREDRGVIRLWLNEMEEFGPDHVARSAFWGDHPLYGEWRGFRASCFSNSGRIIYRVQDDEIFVEVHRVTTDHNYRK